MIVRASYKKEVFTFKMSSSDDYFSADEDAWDEGSFLDMRSVDLDVLVDFGFFVVVTGWNEVVPSFQLATRFRMQEPTF